EVDGVFARLQPRIDARLRSGDSPRRLVVVLYGQGIAIQRDKLWGRLRGMGTRVPLRLGEHSTAEAFLHGLFGTGGRVTSFPALGQAPGHGPHDAWLVETGESLHALCEAGGAAGAATGLSYERLRALREQLARSLYTKVVSGVSGPQELAAYAPALDAAPPEGSLLHSDRG